MAYAQTKPDDGRDAILPLNRVMEASRALSQSLEILANGLLAEAGMTTLERSLLMDVRKNRQQTVPQLARRRGFSRQHVQTTVNPLVEKGWLTFRDNPAHKRSRLVVLTEKGEAAMRAVMIREGHILQQLAPGLDPAGTAAAAGILAEIRRRVEKISG